MVYARSWDVCEDECLRVAVRSHGRSWEDVSGGVPGRSAESCRIRWRKIRGSGAGGGIPPVGGGSEPPDASCNMQPFGCMRPLKMSAAALQRSPSGGRPWDYVVRRSLKAKASFESRRVSARQLRLIRN